MTPVPIGALEITPDLIDELVAGPSLQSRHSSSSSTGARTSMTGPSNIGASKRGTLGIRGLVGPPPALFSRRAGDSGPRGATQITVSFGGATTAPPRVGCATATAAEMSAVCASALAMVPPSRRGL
jgi:hypothetical protein